MSTPNRFHAEQVNPESAGEIQEALNSLVDRDAVSKIVDWDVIEAQRGKKLNIVIEYQPSEEV